MCLRATERGRTHRWRIRVRFCVCVCVFTLARKAHGGLLRSTFMIPTSKVNVKARCLQVTWSTNPDGFSSLRGRINCSPSFFLYFYTIGVSFSTFFILLRSVWSEGFGENLYNKVAICRRHPAERTNRKEGKGTEEQGIADEIIVLVTL